MAAVAVTFDGTRVDAADAGGNWDELDTTKTAGVNNDLFYQNTGSISDKITTTGGLEYEAAAAVDFASGPVRCVLFKTLITTTGLIDTFGPNGNNLRVGSDQNNYYTYYLTGNGTYPPSRSWLFTLVDPNHFAHRWATTGTPSLTAVDYAALQLSVSASSARDDNCAIDAYDYLTQGTGLTLVGGDGGDTDGWIGDFVSYDQSTIANRYGVVSTRQGIVFAVAMLSIGDDRAAVFTDSNQTVVFEAGFGSAGAVGFLVSTGHASSAFSITNYTVGGTGSDGRELFVDNISSVDTTTDDIDYVAHGLEDGDAVVYSVEGGSNAIGGLVDATGYWVIKTSDDSFALTESHYGSFGDVRLVLADATNFTVGGYISGDGVGGNTGVGIVVAIATNDVTVLTISGAWVASNGVDNVATYSSNETTISSIETTTGGFALTAGASRENHSFTRTPDQRPDFITTITINVASSTGFYVGGVITGDGDAGNDGVGLVRAIRTNALQVQTITGSWVSGNGVDNALPYVGDQTTISSIVSSGTVEVTGGALNQHRAINLSAGSTLTNVVMVGPSAILQSGGTMTGCLFSEQATGEGKVLIAGDDIDLVTGSTITAGTEGHFYAQYTTGTYDWDGNVHTGYWAPTENGWNFDTITGVDASTDIITTDAAHGFTTGDAVFYNSEGGTDTTNLVNETKYYVRVLSSTTLTIHETRASAELNLAIFNLIDGATGETHSLYSGKATVVNASGGLVTLDVVNGATAPSIRNTTGSSTVVNTGVVDTSVHVNDNTGANLASARVILEAGDATGVLPFEESVTITHVTTVATVSHTGHGMKTNDLAVIRGADQEEYNGAFTITVTTANAYTYTMGSDPGADATGTITSTGGVLQGLTDASGDITSSRSWASAQPVRGYVRKSSASPRFKSFNLSGNTISTTDGLAINVRMVLDE